MQKNNSNKITHKKVQLNKVKEMIDYYKYYGSQSDKEIKEHDIQFLSEQLVFLTSLFQEINDYEFNTQKDAYNTLKELQKKIRKNVDFSIPVY